MFVILLFHQKAGRQNNVIVAGSLGKGSNASVISTNWSFSMFYKNLLE